MTGSPQERPAEERAALVEQYRKEYAKLTDAKLAKKIRHLKGAAGRCTLQRNADLILDFLDVALAIARNRRIAGAPDAR